MNVVFESFPPCEETFRYLTHLACVCKVWLDCATATRFNRVWQQPMRDRAMAYYNKIDEARSHLDLGYFMMGMNDYFSISKMQEKIIRKMFQATGNAQQEFDVLERFYETDASVLIPLLCKLGNYHVKNIHIFHAICKITGILCELDESDGEDVPERINLCIEHKMIDLLLKGVTVHNEGLTVQQCEIIICALTKLGRADIRILQLGVYYMRCFPESVKIAERFMLFMMNTGCDDGSDKFVVDKCVLELIIQTAHKHVSSITIQHTSCCILGYFAHKTHEALCSVVTSSGIRLLIGIVERRLDLGTIKAYLGLMRAIACDPKLAGLLFQHNIIPRILRRLSFHTLKYLVADAAGISELFTTISHCICDQVPSRKTVAAQLIEQSIVNIMHAVMATHHTNSSVHLATISVLGKMSTCCDLKKQHFNKEFVQLMGTNFVHFIDRDRMVAPMLTVFAALIEKSGKGWWTAVAHQHQSHIATATTLHIHHKDVQAAGAKVLMLLAASVAP